jgi:hypothetical protein
MYGIEHSHDRYKTNLTNKNYIPFFKFLTMPDKILTTEKLFSIYVEGYRHEVWNLNVRFYENSNERTSCKREIHFEYR